MNLLVTLITAIQVIVAVAIISVVTALLGKLAGTVAAIGLCALYMLAGWFFSGDGE